MSPALKSMAAVAAIAVGRLVFPALQAVPAIPATAAVPPQRKARLTAEALQASVVSAPACHVALVPSKIGKRKMNNLIVLSVDIAPGGTVTRTTVIRSTGSKETDRQVSGCISHWKFRESTYGMQVTSTVVIDI